ncbi:MAG: hypothetical protein HKO53_07315 [Gemmatimonadetes bacterium]|nr:hypothetical protein [Gemmatimonadota bacterium]
MQHTSNRAIRASLFAALFAVTPALVNAQEPAQDEMPVCVATIDAEALPAGEASVPAMFTLTENIGEVTAIEAGESGLSIADPAEEEATEMATEEAAEATEMAAEASITAHIWLSTLEAQAGQFEVHLVGTEGTCAAQVTIEG